MKSKCTFIFFKMSGHGKNVSHIRGKEEEEKGFQEIISRDQEDRCACACSVGPARDGPHGAAARYIVPPCGQMAKLSFFT